MHSIVGMYLYKTSFINSTHATMLYVQCTYNGMHHHFYGLKDRFQMAEDTYHKVVRFYGEDPKTTEPGPLIKEVS